MVPRVIRMGFSQRRVFLHQSKVVKVTKTQFRTETGQRFMLANGLEIGGDRDKAANKNSRRQKEKRETVFERFKP